MLPGDSPCPSGLGIGGIVLGYLVRANPTGYESIGGKGVMNQNVGARAGKVKSSNSGS